MLYFMENFLCKKRIINIRYLCQNCSMITNSFVNWVVITSLIHSNIEVMKDKQNVCIL